MATRWSDGQKLLHEMRFDPAMELAARNREIRKYRAAGNKLSDLAAHYGLTTRQISRICKGTEPVRRKKCPVCKFTFMATRPDQKVCHDKNCKAVWRRISRQEQKRLEQLDLLVDETGQTLLAL